MPEGMAAWWSLHLVLAAVGTWLARRYALQRRLLDEPGKRRSHAVATPRGGGIAIVLSTLVAMAVLVLGHPAWLPSLALAGTGLLLVALIGWIDDHRPLSPWWRLGVHAVAAGLLGLAAIAGGGGLVQAVWAGALALVLVNVWNFMDGINGLATSQAALVAAVLSFVMLPGSGPSVWVAAALAAACVGFLPFNFPRARIFLGDVGSGALGYLLALLLALGIQVDPGNAWVLLLLCPFLLDAALTLWRRMVRGERWWTPHVQHLYQRLARAWGHTAVTLAYAGYFLLSAFLALFVRFLDPMTIMSAVCGWYLLGAGVWFMTRHYDPNG